MKTLKTRWILAAAAAMLAAGGASAQGTWNLGNTSCNAGGTPGTASCVMGSVTATMSAYSNVTLADASPNPVFKQINLTNNDPNGFGAMNAAGTVAGDLYAAESGSPDHAFDNITNAANREGGTQEFMLISFGSAKVNLSSLQIGWSETGADMSIYRWDGNAVNVSGTSLNGSWSLVSSMDVWNAGAGCTNNNPPGSGGCKQFDAGSGLVSGGAPNLDKYSSWWLVSTYMGSATTNGLDGTKNDSFKLLSFTATLCAQTLAGGSTGGGSTQNNGNGATCGPDQIPAPEPGSLALVGLALSGVYAVRRRPLAVAKAATA